MEKNTTNYFEMVNDNEFQVLIRIIESKNSTRGNKITKFLRIEYQTYRLVNHNLRDEKDIYYRIPEQNKSIRIVYLNGRVIGFNFLGLRYSDTQCRKWIEEKRSIEYVLDHLGEANFDFEFAPKFEKDLKEHN